MKARTILFAAILLAAAVTVRGAADPTVLYPVDLTLVTEPALKIHVARPGGGLPVYVKLNGKVVAKMEGENFLKGEVTLVPGLNLVEAGGRTIRVFLLEGAKMEEFRLSREEGKDPLVFRAYRIHPALDEGCEGCHEAKDGKITAKDQKEACYACHTNFGAEEEGKTKFLHAPVAAGECTGCHDPHFSTRPKLQKLAKGCLECHDPFPTEGVVHRPVAEGECTKCHNPHVSEAPKQLVRPGNALCLGCHADPHRQHRAGEVKGKMTQIPDDVPRDRDELACSACHVPHQSAERRLFRKPQGELCKTCHMV